MAHAGNELRLVLARDLKLTALVLYFREQSRILDRQDRLCGEGLQQQRKLISVSRSLPSVRTRAPASLIARTWFE